MAPSLDDVLAAIKDASKQTGIETYIVGGFVRDRLLGKPGQDIDLLAVGADGLPILETVSRQFNWSKPLVFDRFQTGQVRGDGFVIEIVQARSEAYDPASRKPDVKPGTLEEDIWRRDFTVNALCLSMDDRILDITGRGLQHLKARILRTPLEPNQTFSEDPLRMFRAARFVSQLDFQLASGMLEAIVDESARIEIISAERLNQEFRKLMVGKNPSAGLEVLRNGNLLTYTLPEALEMVGVEQSGHHIFDVWHHTLACVQASNPELILRLACFFHDIAKPRTHELAEDGRHTFYDHPQVGAKMTKEILERLRFSNEEIEAVTTLVKLHLRPIQYKPDEWTDPAVKRLIRDIGPLRPELLALARADTQASSYPHLRDLDELAERMERLDAGGQVSNLVSPLSGEDLIAIAQHPAGRWVGKAKHAIEEAILEGEIPANDRAQAEAWIRARPDLLTP